ncbi:MAG: hypothetical protein E7263_06400 [Lachnospiraceae bacterium]|nr:hypothetical protein [Lachnospiraceae bacterium]
MKKVLVVLLLCGVILVCGCKKEDSTVISTTEMSNNELVVVCSSWSGWSEDYEPVEKTFVYPAIEGEVICPDYKETVDDFEFEILSVNPNSVTIKTNQCMSCSEVGESGINLNSKETVFEIKKGEKIELTTLSMDAGDIYVFEY